MLLAFSFLLQTARALSLSDQPALKESGKSTIHWSIARSTGVFMFSHTLPGENGALPLQKEELLVCKGVQLLAGFRGLYARAIVNIGFEEKPVQFVWSNLPEFQPLLNILEFESSLLIPFKFSWTYSLHPLAGYSYINYLFDKLQRRYHSLQFGFENIVRVSRRIRIDAFFRWSPITQDTVFVRFLTSHDRIRVISALYGLDCMFTFGAVNLSVSFSRRDVLKTKQADADDLYDLHVSKYSVSLKIRL
ncbi:MAG: hypothetical protein NC041_10280 [Bacteroides sp.]|nr:hypothetical protein [Prevotella sp.]MCM1408913.1 hypothetical protein [Treponema brennaborense]MCM1470840.1 hypothetical protein [Bacteroides sp.]